MSKVIYLPPVTSKPFLKWAGGKSKLVPLLINHLGSKGRLVEPFVGSGAVFMGTNFESYLLCDTNSDLIGLFNNLKKNTDKLIKKINTLFTLSNNTCDEYMRLRDKFNTLESEDLVKSALFVYLNKHCFNGLCRYNGSSKFNVPFGRYNAPKVPIDELKSFAEKSRIATFECWDFVKTFENTLSKETVYCDPPYVPLSATSAFTSYTKGGFGKVEQNTLAKLAIKHSKRNLIIISNHDTKFTRELYASGKIHTIQVRRSISSKSSTRVKVKELIAVFG